MRGSPVPPDRKPLIFLRIDMQRDQLVGDVGDEEPGVENPSQACLPSSH